MLLSGFLLFYIKLVANNKKCLINIDGSKSIEKARHWQLVVKGTETRSYIFKDQHEQRTALTYLDKYGRNLVSFYIFHYEIITESIDRPRIKSKRRINHVTRQM